MRALFKRIFLLLATVLFLLQAASASAHNMPLGSSRWCFGKDHIAAVIELNSLLFGDIKDVKDGHYDLETISDEELRTTAINTIQPYIDRKLTLTVNEKNYPVKITRLAKNENGLFQIWLSVEAVEFSRPSNPVRIDYRLLFDETDNQHVNLAFLYLTDAAGAELQKVLDFSQPDGQYTFDNNTPVWEVTIQGNAENINKEYQSGQIKNVHVSSVKPNRYSRMPLSGIQSIGSFHIGKVLDSRVRGNDDPGNHNNPAKEQWWAGIRKFILLGIEHILTGYDHIAFLLALIVIGLSIREVLKVITAFTVAHSITLLLAALQIVSINSRVVECVIAFSICYVALENVLKKEVNYRWLVTFGFGLVHGFGFASALRELIAGKSNLLVSVVSFNAGIELGQVMIFLVLLPVLHLLRNKIEFRKVTVAASLAIFLLGFVWLVERGFNLKLLPI